MTPQSPRDVTRIRAFRAASILAGALIASLSPADAASAQCSMCRDAVAASSTETREAMNYAIIGLALTPYAIAATAAWALSPRIRGLVIARLRRAPVSPEEPE